MHRNEIPLKNAPLNASVLCLYSCFSFEKADWITKWNIQISKTESVFNFMRPCRILWLSHAKVDFRSLHLHFRKQKTSHAKSSFKETTVWQHRNIPTKLEHFSNPGNLSWNHYCHHHPSIRPNDQSSHWQSLPSSVRARWPSEHQEVGGFLDPKLNLLCYWCLAILVGSIPSYTRLHPLRTQVNPKVSLIT